jgi:hypothetical protein
MRFRSLSDFAVKIMRHAGRQAATRNNKRRRRRDARNGGQTFLRFNIAERSPREDKAKLFAGPIAPLNLFD